MTIRYLIAAALMASACAAHADVIPSSGGAGIVSGSNVAGAVGDSSVIAGVTRGANSDALVQALFAKVSASVGHDMKVTLKQGVDGVYVTGLSTAKAAALAGDGMSVVVTPDGFKIVDNTGAGSNTATSGGGASNTGSGGPTFTPAITPPVSLPGNAVLPSGPDISVGVGGNQGQDATAVPEPSSIALMLAGMLGVAGLKRRRAR
ncbi:hypothetical protein SRABI118_04061 [Massilia sp. Bi118]|uniref:PEP-CTERM sorting domain-containing protein n=1 Tax=Massilia sp. Bi118 TaxID=2822346 RepID=UPI001DC1192B|nr:PEP-CTERM sorting domain-containing protein [Massilia sp. Bi118]CAH0290608.1 hypothetical protein SRABI118_04061 [Massilia sp. Bi118]